MYLLVIMLYSALANYNFALANCSYAPANYNYKFVETVNRFSYNNI